MPAAGPRDILVLLGAVLGLSVGNVLLKIGMTRLDAAPAGALWTTLATTWQLPVGILLMTAQFVGMLMLFKWGWEVSVVVPLLGLNYVVTALIGQAWLGERVDGVRWVGIALILVGVACLARNSAPPAPSG